MSAERQVDVSHIGTLIDASVTTVPDVAKEHLVPPGYRLVGRFTLTGYPGTGKGEVSRILAESYGLSHDQVRRAGDIFFRKDQHVTAFQDRPIREDKYADDTQLDWLTDPDPTNVFELETRAAAVLYRLYKEKLQRQHRKLPPVPVETILLTAPPHIRLDRATRRDMAKNPGMSYEEVRRETVLRQDRDLRRLQVAHPQLRRINPLSEKSARYYDHVVDTRPSQEEVAFRIHQILVAAGVVEKVDKTQELNASQNDLELSDDGHRAII